MLILASASPRRQEILHNAAIPFETRPAEVDESHRRGESARDYVLRLAEAKARAVAQPGETVLGADTVVVVEGRILGKPADPDEAKLMLRLALRTQARRSNRRLCSACRRVPNLCRTDRGHF